MANSAQARKRARQALKQRAHNAALRTAFRTAVKKVIKTIEAGDKAAAELVYKESVKIIGSLITEYVHSSSGFDKPHDCGLISSMV